MLAGDDKLKRYDDYIKHCWPLFSGHLSCVFTETRTPRIHLLLPGFHPKFPMGEWIYGMWEICRIQHGMVQPRPWCEWLLLKLFFFPVLYLYLHEYEIDDDDEYDE